MKAIEKLREWYQSKKGHCDALIKDIVLSGHKVHGESKEDRSHQEEMFIKGLENLKGYVDRLEDQVNLPGKLEEAITVLVMVANLGIGNNDTISKVLKSISNNLEGAVSIAKEQDVQASLRILEKKLKIDNTIVGIDLKQIKKRLEIRNQEQKPVVASLHFLRFFQKIDKVLRGKIKEQVHRQNNPILKVFNTEAIRGYIAEFLGEIKDKINFLYQLAKFQEIGITGNLNLSTVAYIPLKQIVDVLASKVMGLTHLNLEGYRFLPVEALEIFISNSKNLTYLNLSESTVDDAVLQMFSKSCPNIKRLDVNKCKRITFKGIVGFKNLEILNYKHTHNDPMNMQWLYCDNFDGFDAMIQSCTKLTHLDLAEAIPPRNIINSLPSARYLSRFDISLLRIDDKISFYKQWFENTSELVHLDLNFYSRENDDVMRLIVKNMKKLKSFSFDPTLVQYEDLSNITGVLNGLTELELRGDLDAKQSGLIFPNLKNIRRLFLDYCNLTVTPSLVGDDVFISYFYYLKGLTHLTIESYSSITQNGWQKIFNQCFKLTHVVLRRVKITIEGIQLLASNCRLQRLDLIECNELDDKGLMNLQPSFKYLTSFALTTNKRVTSVGANTVVGGCEQLTDLDLHETASSNGLFNIQLRNILNLNVSNTGFTDEMLKVVSDYCKSLNKLDISINKITDLGLEYLFPFIAQLTHADFNFTDITAQGLKRMSDHCKKLKYLGITMDIRPLNPDWQKKTACNRVNQRKEGLKCLMKIFPLLREVKCHLGKSENLDTIKLEIGQGL